MKFTKHIVNDHFVLVPHDMKVVHESGFPGAFDHIDYLDFQFTTFDRDEDDIYSGPFALVDDPLVEFESLEEAREWAHEMSDEMTS